MAVIDPGPDDAQHIGALLHALETAEEVRILLTHGHPDHAGGAARLTRLSGASLLAPAGYSPPEAAGVPVERLRRGGRIPTDQGELETVEVPGHTRDHLAFFWTRAGAVFVGDLLLGRGNTTWIGEYPGCVADYLESLDRLEALGASVFYPAHGPPISSPSLAVERFRRHRLKRLEQIRIARDQDPEAGAAALARSIYGGEIPSRLLRAAERSVRAALYHLDHLDGGVHGS